MIGSFFRAVFYDPLYNILILFIGFVPGGDVGVAVIALTLVVKFALLPVLFKGARTQAILRSLEPKLAAIREKMKDTPEEMAKATFALYKEYKVNPFSALIPVLVQTPFLLALFFIFSRGGLPDLKLDILYPFVTHPEQISMHLFGLFEVTRKSIVLAFIAAGSQFVYSLFSLPPLETRKADASFKDDFARSFQLNIRYILPAIIGVFAYTLPSAVAISWITGNIFGTIQELYVRRRLTKEGILPQKV